uniref:Uncharacterized protein n=1 Tax=Rhizophora mucronata TaxID=61149 RepID=A0A2P2PLU7_RHIMU
MLSPFLFWFLRMVQVPGGDLNVELEMRYYQAISPIDYRGS